MHKLPQTCIKSQSLEFFINFVPLMLEEENINFSVSTTMANYDMFTTPILMHIEV